MKAAKPILREPRENQTRAGVRDAWDEWLSEHPISVPEMVEAAIAKAVDEWLSAHTDELLEVFRRVMSERSGEVDGMVKFYRDENDGRPEVCIETDAADERGFLEECARRLDTVLVDAAGEPEKREWLRRVVDICCKMRGYKADVVERRVIQAGTLPPSDANCVADSRGAGNGTTETDEELRA